MTKRFLLAVVLLLSCSGKGGVLAQDNDGLSPQLRAQLLESLDRGLAYLKENQKENGSWENHPGLTGMASSATLNRPGNDSNPDYVQPALVYLVSLVKPDGGIYDRDTPSYNTAVALQALVASGNPSYREIIENAKEFIVELQADEGEGYTTDDQFYGGVGYGSDLRPDLTNLELALESLKKAEVPENHPVWVKALKFVQRSQNYVERNDQAWAGTDGGFVYYPGFSYAEGGGTESYGSVTYAGLLIYSYAKVRRDDPRVRVALDWIRKNYTVEENPGMGLRTLYYYYLVFAKALNAYQESIIVDEEGVSHNWREDLGKKLLAEQHPEGYWVNEDPSYMQDNKVLVTSFASLTLEQILEEN